MSQLDALIKFAAMQTYCHSSYAKRRNYTPPPCKIKPTVVQEDDTFRKVVTPKTEKLDNTLRGVNRNYDPREDSKFNNFVKSFSPTISGTGHGRAYWGEPRNPYQI